MNEKPLTRDQSVEKFTAQVLVLVLVSCLNSHFRNSVSKRANQFEVLRGNVGELL